MREMERFVRAHHAKALEQEKKPSSPKSPSRSDQVRMPGFVGMLKDGQRDLAARAKEIVRGSDHDK
ncbi:hypothetical protein [Micromonospora echinaurantiaca]|uniref:hypothetical protein n=1 Tax=Micromonospora echinaurantiaca TaxID=47857 RepID=UPI003436AA4C